MFSYLTKHHFYSCGMFFSGFVSSNGFLYVTRSLSQFINREVLAGTVFFLLFIISFFSLLTEPRHSGIRVTENDTTYFQPPIFFTPS